MTKIYLDLDGVFADFEKAVVNFHKEPKAAFWKKVQDIPNFFASLDLIEGSKEAFDIVYDYELIHNIPVEILTALPRPTKHLVTADSDKHTWVHQNLHPNVTVNCADGWGNKIKWVAKDHILIDDMLRNIRHWQEHGGIGIHHTGKWGNTLTKLHHAILVTER